MWRMLLEFSLYSHDPLLNGLGLVQPVKRRPDFYVEWLHGALSMDGIVRRKLTAQCRVTRK
jgi:hypothetical protein